MAETAPFRDDAPIAWESTTPCFIRFIPQWRYERFKPEVRRWYKPYRCSCCEARERAEAAGVPVRRVGGGD